ncbi:ArsR family transcriptional regulator [Streptomyces sp. NPDC059680]|uniref:ArsR family transcriptional regulator n=1 Tax=Streptomyces sp. NPDC059680 TaxID=3346904 RepID=UPI0036A09EA0
MFRRLGYYNHLRWPSLHDNPCPRSWLGQRPAIISRLAAQLDAKKGNVAHDLKVLREAGLVHIAVTRYVRGGTEQYQRTARRMVVTEPQAAGTAAMLAAVAQELDRSPA